MSTEKKQPTKVVEKQDKNSVILKSKDAGHQKEFSVEQANGLLNLRNTKWALDDKDYDFKGKEIHRRGGKTSPEESK